MNIKDYGWNEFFEQNFASYQAQGLIPARVIMRNRENYKLVCDKGIHGAKLSGKYKHTALLDGTMPVVGDWVAIKNVDGSSDSLIQAMAERKTCFSRKQAISGGRKIKNGVIQGGATVEQVLAANIDTVFIVSGLDGNFNLSRIERYLTVATSSGASPVVLLNKADLCAEPEVYVSKVNEVARNVPVHCISVITGNNIESLSQYMAHGKTLAFLGSSGVGKSTIINSLFGEEKQNTKATSGSNGKGRHTTTCAELFLHESGCLLIDTPGLRELKLWCDEQSVNENFEDILLLSGECKFNDCSHKTEPGCAIREALYSGRLSQERFNNFKKLHIEVEDLKARKKQKELYIAGKIKKMMIE